MSSNNYSKHSAKLDTQFIDDLVDVEPWKIALKLNLLNSKEGSRFTINDTLDKYSSAIRSKFTEEKFKELNGVVAYANSMLLDFESALPYALIENNNESLISLEENALLYGRNNVVSALDAFGRQNNIFELIVDKKDMQNFLIYHALPQIRLCKRENVSSPYRYDYEIEPNLLNSILDNVGVDKKSAVYTALNLLEEKHNQNIPRKLIFSKILGDGVLTDMYKKEFKEKYLTPRSSIDALVKERAIFSDSGEISRLQFGDENPLFPTASNIFLVNKSVDGVESKKVWKEDLKLYTNFSRLDGYSSEREILSELDHSNIVKLLGTFNEKNIHFLELEYVSGKSLDKYVDLSEKEALGITITLCDVLNYLHSKNILYMDMKKKNVMYDRNKDFNKGINNDFNHNKDNHNKDLDTDLQNNQENITLESIAKNVKLLDFGMSQKAEKLDTNTVLTTLLSTPEYLSPELTGFRASIATDTFQLGLLLHDLVYKKHAFVDDSIKLTEGDEFRESEVLMYGLAVKFGKYTPNKDSYGSLLSKMFEKEPSKRPDLNYVRTELMNIYASKFNSELSSTTNSVLSVPASVNSILSIPALSASILSKPISSDYNLSSSNLPESSSKQNSLELSEVVV